jgi:hydrogenase maturation factor
MLLVIDQKDAEYCIKRAHDFNIEARICGEVTKESVPTLRIESLLHDVQVSYEVRESK